MKVIHILNSLPTLLRISFTLTINTSHKLSTFFLPHCCPIIKCSPKFHTRPTPKYVNKSTEIAILHIFENVHHSAVAMTDQCWFFSCFQQHFILSEALHTFSSITYFQQHFILSAAFHTFSRISYYRLYSPHL